MTCHNQTPECNRHLRHWNTGLTVLRNCTKSSQRCTNSSALLLGVEVLRLEVKASGGEGGIFRLWGVRTLTWLQSRVASNKEVLRLLCISRSEGFQTGERQVLNESEGVGGEQKSQYRLIRHNGHDRGQVDTGAGDVAAQPATRDCPQGLVSGVLDQMGHAGRGGYRTVGAVSGVACLVGAVLARGISFILVLIEW